MKRVLITGANGFVGSYLGGYLRDRYEVIGAVRSEEHASHLAGGVRPCIVGDLRRNDDWADPLSGVDTIVHSAARVHVMHDASSDPLAEFREVNVAATERLARAAAAHGIRRLVYISSIKVNGESTGGSRGFTEEDDPNPSDAYGISKWEAELLLRKIALETGIEVVIVRPTLVYGPRVKANFLSLLNWVYRGVPLPLGGIANERSMVSLLNLCSLIHRCIDHPAAANETFLASDGEDLSTTDLVQRIGARLGRPARLFTLPRRVVNGGARLLGKEGVATRLYGSLVVRPIKARTILNRSPPFTVDQGLTEVARWYLAQRNPSTAGRER